MAKGYRVPAQAASDGPSWLRNDDPLGIGLRERSRQSKAEFNPSGLGSMGPLQDPAWDAFFQSMDEQGVSEVGQSGGQFGALPSTIDPNLPQTGMTGQLARSSHIGNVMGGLNRAVKRGKR